MTPEDATSTDSATEGPAPEAATPSLPLQTPLPRLPGVNPKLATALRAQGLETLRDLLEYLPRDYRSESAERDVEALVIDEIQSARGEIVAVDYVSGRRPSRFEATLQDATGKLAIVWFNASYLRTKLRPGMRIRVRGKVKTFRNIPQMVNPKYESVDDATPKDLTNRFRPVYPATADLPSEQIEQLVAGHLDSALPNLDEWFPAGLLHRHRLMSRREAYAKIHRPDNAKQAAEARRRLVYDELMLLQLALSFSRRRREGRISAPVLRLDKTLDARIKARLGFEMTTAQQRAAWQIAADMATGTGMNRLLQGDVGSGKTAVALYAMLVAVANKMQAALLAPTEVLAEQHAFNLRNMLGESSVNIELVTGRTRRGTKRSGEAMLERLEAGQVDIAVGTQALIQKGIDFANLGLVVVDEQHRLGVRQRAVLRGKGYMPHYLVMTATPIPRTLALSFFADFDVSIIDELPPGRQPIRTRWSPYKDLGKVYGFVAAEVDKGRRAYVVFPQIEGSGMTDNPDDVRGLVVEHQALQDRHLPGVAVGMMHGRMTSEEKQQVMADFRSGAVQVLAATTVIEVGVDVPEATVIVIHNAERFGLSQLHQLRGRVGRGEHASTCILLSDATGRDVEQRLGAMVKTNDGFEIAEADLKLRGPGDFFGTRQSGLPPLKVADIGQELELLHVAKDEALALLEHDPDLDKLPVLRQALFDRFGETLNLAQVG
ncbi:MAG: ATP-dependent DNA helicase RecG [Phycisphaerae bacterium]